jgi:hypothetical protein
MHIYPEIVSCSDVGKICVSLLSGITLQDASRSGEKDSDCPHAGEVSGMICGTGFCFVEDVHGGGNALSENFHGNGHA